MARRTASILTVVLALAVALAGGAVRRGRAEVK